MDNTLTTERTRSSTIKKKHKGSIVKKKFQSKIDVTAIGDVTLSMNTSPSNSLNSPKITLIDHWFD